MLPLAVVLSSLAAPVPAPPAGANVEATTYTGHFEKNTSGLKGETSVLAFADAEVFGKVFGTVPPLMGKGANKPNPVPFDAFEKGLVVAVVKRKDATATYSDVTTTLAGDTLTVNYKAAFGPGGTANFATPLILGVPKDGVKRVVFVEDGKEAGTVEVK